MVEIIRKKNRNNIDFKLTNKIFESHSKLPVSGFFLQVLHSSLSHSKHFLSFLPYELNSNKLRLLKFLQY